MFTAFDSQFWTYLFFFFYSHHGEFHVKLDSGLIDFNFTFTVNGLFFLCCCMYGDASFRGKTVYAIFAHSFDEFNSKFFSPFYCRIENWIFHNYHKTGNANLLKRKRKYFRAHIVEVVHVYTYNNGCLKHKKKDTHNASRIKPASLPWFRELTLILYKLKNVCATLEFVPWAWY